MITVDRLDRLADAVRIGRRSLLIARQSVLVGIGLSARRDGRRRARLSPPVAGALLQEVIDVAVILNALRALRPGRGWAAPAGGPRAPRPLPASVPEAAVPR